MNRPQHAATGAEARHTQPRRPWQADEKHRQNALLRYLGAITSTSASRSHNDSARPAPTPPETGNGATPRTLRVREVMTASAATVLVDMPFLDLVRTLSHDHLGAVPVADTDGHVVGVVSESDLLAKAAVESASESPGPIRRIREHRLYDKGQGETAGTLMTAPAITVLPGTPVAEAAWVAASSRLKRLPVTDHEGRLVGTVTRMDLLAALVRDDARIREEVCSRIIEQELGIAPGVVEVHVDDGVVALKGRLPLASIAELFQKIWEIEDVVGIVDDLTET